MAGEGIGRRSSEQGWVAEDEKDKARPGVTDE